MLMRSGRGSHLALSQGIHPVAARIFYAARVTHSALDPGLHPLQCGVSLTLEVPE
ncbi:MAG: hypothetical protein AB1511_13725 [Deinococcota bacterium]